MRDEEQASFDSDEPLFEGLLKTHYLASLMPSFSLDSAPLSKPRLHLPPLRSLFFNAPLWALLTRPLTQNIHFPSP